MSTATTSCLNCGAENQSGQFCMTCGATLAEGQPAGVPGPAAAPRAAYQQPVPPAAQAGVSAAAPLATHPSPARAAIQVNGTSWTTGANCTVKDLGERVDGWADLLDGLGDRADTLGAEFRQSMASRNLPNIQLETAILTAASMSGDRRPFLLARTKTGATTTVRIGTFGSDLYLAWDLYVRPILNPIVIVAIIGIAFLFASGSLSLGMFAIPAFLISLVFHCIWMSAVVGFAGRVVRGNWLGFFFKEVTPFDANDIAAMTLAVHHSLLQAADVVGVDVHQLRAKELFRGGRNRLF